MHVSKKCDVRISSCNSTNARRTELRSYNAADNNMCGGANNGREGMIEEQGTYKHAEGSAEIKGIELQLHIVEQ
jgi:hypothetical protein